MPPIEKITHEDLILYEIVRHPVLFGEFFRNIDLRPHEEPWEFTIYQKEFICDFANYVSICCGRTVGKTEALVSVLIWILVNNVYRGDYVVYTVPNKVHLDPVWDGLVKFFRGNSIISQFVEKRSGINSSDHNIKCNNYASLDCRIAGTTGTGASVVGMHTPFEVLDEAGFYPWGTWIELQPTLNTWEQGYRQVVSGVPTGVREQNVLYYTDEMDDDFTKHRISAHQNPRYTEEDEARNLEKYGGVDGQDYIHHVLGRHGTPVFAVFDRTLMSIVEYPVYKIKIDGIKITDVSEIYSKISNVPPIEKRHDYVIMGIDLGYTDPTAIHILYNSGGTIKYHARIQLTKVPYPLQKQVISFIDERFQRPDVIGIDAGGPGKPVVQDFLEAEEFLHKDFVKRMIPVEFGSQLILGQDNDGNDIKVRMKPFAVSLTQEYANSHRIVFSSTDYEFISELERTTYTKNPSGEIVYRTLTPKGGQRGDDHHTTALLCAMIAQYQLKDAITRQQKKPRLYTPTWLQRSKWIYD